MALLTWQSLLKNKADDCRNEGPGVLGWLIIDGSNFCVFCGNGVDGKKPFLIVRMFPCDDLAEGDAKE